MKTIILLICFVTLFSFSGDAARACSCVPSNEVVEGFSVKRWLKEFDGAMFTGHVTKIERVMVKQREKTQRPKASNAISAAKPNKSFEMTPR